MATKPLTINAGRFERLPDGEGLDVGGWNLPTAGGTINYVLNADSSGHAVWTSVLAGLTSLTVDNININGAIITSDTGAISFSNENLSTSGTVTGSNIPSPTIDDQVLISTAAGIAGWQTAGANQYLASGGTGEVAWAAKPVAMANPTADDQLLVATGADAASWTDTLDILKVDSITIDGSTITSSDTTIGFGAENLSTTGDLTVGRVTSWRDNSGGGDSAGIFTRNQSGGGVPNDVIRMIFEDDGSLVDGTGPSIHFENKEVATASNIIAKIAARRREGDDTSGSLDFYTYSAGAATNGGRFNPDGSFTLLVGLTVTGGPVTGSNIPSPTVDDQVLISTAADTAAWSTAGNNQYLASDGTGEVAWIDKPTGFTDPTVDDQVLISTAAGAASWSTASTNQFLASDGTGEVAWTNKSFGVDIPANSAANEIYVGTGAGTAAWTTDLAGLTSLTVDNITINGAVISSDTGAISFSNENLTTTGTLTSGLLTVTNNTFPVGDFIRTTSSTSSLGTVFRLSFVSSGDVTDGFGPGIQFAISDTGVTNSFLAAIYGERAGADNTGDLVFYCNAAGSVTERMRLTSAGVLSGITSLVVDNITINGAVISSDTGAISFSNDNLTTTGTVIGSNIPSPSTSGKALVSTATDTAAWFTTSLYDVLKIEVPSASGAERKFVLTADPGSQFEIEAAPWPLTLTANETIYIRTDGNDTTGDGSVVFPFLTLEKTIEYLGQLYIGDYTVTVDIGEGVFTEAGTLSFQHPYGSQVTWQGVSEQITSQDTNSISASGTSLTFSNLYYYDVTFILPVGKSVSVGDYIAVRAVSGGTLPNALLGCHYVSTWVGGSRTATVRVVYRNGAPKASGTVTCTIELIKTVIAFSNKNGIKLNGTYTGGAWRGLVLQGDYNTTNTNAKYGIWLLNSSMLNFGGSEVSGDAVGIVGFQTGMYAQNNAMMFGDYCFVSRCGTRCANAQNGGILNLRYAHLSGANNEGIFCFNGSTCAGQNVSVVGVGNNSVYSYQGSFIDARTAYVDENNATNAFLADRWASIDANSSSYSDSISPATPGNNDGSYVIIA